MYLQEEAAKTDAALHTLYSHLRDSSARGLLPPINSLPLLHLPPADDESVLSTASSCVPSDDDNDFDPDRLCSQLALSSLCLLQHYPPEFIRDEARQALFSSSINVQDRNLLDLLLNSRLPCRFEELFVTKDLNFPVTIRESTALSLPESVTLTNTIRRVKVRVILDVAHNIPALSALMKKLKNKFNSNVRYCLVCSCIFGVIPVL